MANEVLIHTTAVSLDWNDVTSATKYHLQISSEIDFSDLEHEDNNLAASADTHILTGGVGKYYWRWRAYVVTWQPWQEVSSFTYDSGLASAVTASDWKFVDPDDVTDTYTFEEYVKSWKILPENYRRAFTRNRKGTLLDEWYATKAKILLDISRSYVGENERPELLRFYNMHKAVYLVARLDNSTETDYHYHAWKVQFMKPPQLTVPGGNNLDLEEV